MANVFELKTTRAMSVRTLFTTVKDILVETSMTLTPSGIYITDMDDACNVLIDMALGAENFDHYMCSLPTIKIIYN